MDFFYQKFHRNYVDYEGPGISVSVATDYGLDGPGIESWWGRDFSHTSRPALVPTQPPVQWVLGLSLTTHPLLALRFRMSRATSLLPLYTLGGLLWGDLYLYVDYIEIVEHAMMQLVEALHYKLEGCRFDS
jgi:hypothetical protein